MLEIVSINIFIHLNVCIYDIKLTNITNNEVISITISDESMSLFELNEKLTVARQRVFIFNQINKLTISCYLKFPMPVCDRRSFQVVSQNREYVDDFCNDSNNPFHFACQKWINQLN